MFQDNEKLEKINEAILHAAKLTKYIYNHCHSLYLMRKHTGRREILRPAHTHFTTNCIALQSILTHKNGPGAMITSRDWTSSAYSKKTRQIDLWNKS